VREAQSLALDHLAEVFVIRNHERNFDRQFPGAPAPEQIREAMAEFADENDDARFCRLLAQGPVGPEVGGKRLEGLAQRL